MRPKLLQKDKLIFSMAKSQNDFLDAGGIRLYQICFSFIGYRWAILFWASGHPAKALLLASSWLDEWNKRIDEEKYSKAPCLLIGWRDQPSPPLFDLCGLWPQQHREPEVVDNITGTTLKTYNLIRYARWMVTFIQIFFHLDINGS